MTIGPTLPPHLLAKRKREDGDDDDSSSSSSSSPQPQNANSASRSSTPDGEKRRRVQGPAPPPAPLNEMPPVGPDASESDGDSSSDDGFGPAPPSAAEAAKANCSFPDPGLASTDNQQAHAASQTSDYGILPRDGPRDEPKQNQRDEWMTLPPDADGLASRMDPTKLRARGFVSGRAARAAGSGNTGVGDMSTWTETPEQKRMRLKNEVMGVAAPEGKKSKGSERDIKSKQDEETARRLREKGDKARGPSLLEQHKGKADKVEEEDDPSKRAFDREKDMAVSSRMGHKEKQQMFSRMKDFSSQFSGGKYL